MMIATYRSYFGIGRNGMEIPFVCLSCFFLHVRAGKKMCSSKPKRNRTSSLSARALKRTQPGLITKIWQITFVILSGMWSTHACITHHPNIKQISSYPKSVVSLRFSIHFLFGLLLFPYCSKKRGSEKKNTEKRSLPAFGSPSENKTWTHRNTHFIIIFYLFGIATYQIIRIKRKTKKINEERWIVAYINSWCSDLAIASFTLRCAARAYCSMWLELMGLGRRCIQHRVWYVVWAKGTPYAIVSIWSVCLRATHFHLLQIDYLTINIDIKESQTTSKHENSINGVWIQKVEQIYRPSANHVECAV